MGSSPWDDYYALLGIDEDADDEALRRAWRRLALRWHPDRGGPDTTMIFQKISAAYAVLSDPAARAAYDRARGISPRGSGAPRKDAAAAAAPASAADTADSGPIRRRAPGVLLTRLSRPLDILLASNGARRVEDGLIELFLDAEEAAQGGMITISMRVPVTCPACAGRAAPACDHCASHGTIEDLYSAWLAVPPEVADGTLLHPSARLRGMVRPVTFRVRIAR